MPHDGAKSLRGRVTAGLVTQTSNKYQINGEISPEIGRSSEQCYDPSDRVKATQCGHYYASYGCPGSALKERLQEYALLAEIIGGIAIVASLIFVGFQVQQTAEETALNTRQMQADAYQDLVSQITSMNQLGVTNPRVNVLANSGTKLEDMNDEERAMVSSLIIMMFRMSDMAYHQFEQGMISEERLISAVGPLSDNICNPIYGTIWGNISKNFVSTYKTFVSNLLNNCI